MEVSDAQQRARKSGITRSISHAMRRASVGRSYDGAYVMADAVTPSLVLSNIEGALSRLYGAGARK